MRSRHTIWITCVLAGLAMASAKGRAAPTQPDTPVFEQDLRINDQPHHLWVTDKTYDFERIDREGKKINQRMRFMEVFVRPVTAADAQQPPAAPAKSRRILAMGGVDARSDGAVTGDPVVNIATSLRNNRTMIVLALANTYYAGKQIMEIDPSQTLADIPTSYTQDASGQWSPECPCHVEDQTQSLIKMPEHLDGVLSGTKSMTVQIEGTTVALTIQPASGEAVKVTYDSQRKRWQKAPAR